MKTAIFIILLVIAMAAAAFFFIPNERGSEGPDRSAFDANDQALSNGLIVIDKRVLPKAESSAAGIYDGACAFCHDLPDPASHDGLEWEFVVNRMEELIVEVRGREKRVPVPWNEEIKEEILAYLTQHAFKGMNPADLPDKPEKGAKIFKKICAACHTLPDPSMHSLLVWEYVISKMRQFQKDMGMTVMTDSESADLLLYLESLSGPNPIK